MAKDGEKCREEVLDSIRVLTECLNKLVEVFDKKEKFLADDDLLQKLQKALSGDLAKKAQTKSGKAQALGADSIVQLNVGGNTEFVTTRGTFTCVPSSRLGRIFKEGWDDMLPKDSEGRIFLDMDPVQFGVLMDWLADVKQQSPEDALPPHPQALLRPEQQYGFASLCRQMGVPWPSRATPSTVKGLFAMQTKTPQPDPNASLRNLLTSTIRALQGSGKADLSQANELTEQATSVWQKIDEWHESLALRQTRCQEPGSRCPKRRSSFSISQATEEMAATQRSSNSTCAV